MDNQPHEKILVIGAAGQIGLELVAALRDVYGNANVVASDIRIPNDSSLANDGPFAIVNILNETQLRETIEAYEITTVYMLAAMLSAKAEQNISAAWELNMNGLFNVLQCAKEGLINKLFWPSSIAVFGPNTPADSTPQETVCEPSTVYGISKLAGEQWCNYFFHNYGVDVRSIRYPGLIGYKSEPGGGTTDYAVEIFHKALDTGSYTCFLGADRSLPMMYMEEAIRATIAIMQAPAENVKVRTSYNLGGISFSPAQIASSIKSHLPNFTIDYAPDFRDSIAASWPNSIDDSAARRDWNWNSDFNLDKLTSVMIDGIRKKKVEPVTF
jgi:nucleoside-diphosphate-sugar epimerase